jgi:hypothetical protein
MTRNVATTSGSKWLPAASWMRSRAASIGMAFARADIRSRPSARDGGTRPGSRPAGTGFAPGAGDGARQTVRRAMTPIRARPARFPNP